MESDVANMSNTWRDHVVMWVKDASRAIDYVESRPDLDHDKIAYYGYGWRAEMGGLCQQSSRALRLPCSRWEDSTSSIRCRKSMSLTLSRVRNNPS
jgi:hypothetical protein